MQQLVSVVPQQPAALYRRVLPVAWWMPGELPCWLLCKICQGRLLEAALTCFDAVARTCTAGQDSTGTWHTGMLGQKLWPFLTRETPWEAGMLGTVPDIRCERVRPVPSTAAVVFRW